MIEPESALLPQLLAAVAARGVVHSVALQALLGRSQATVSRLVAEAGPQLLVLGAGRRTRYALPQTILGQAAQQPLWWVYEDGRVERWGRLSFLRGEFVHVQARGIDLLTRGALPWFLAPLRTEGFIGRQLARDLTAWGLAANPAQWSLEQALFAALRTPDAPGAIALGEAAAANPPHAIAAADFDALADTTSGTLPAGSSAGGEQAKFLARRADGAPTLVKFSPPRGTPFGERWHDLLHAEALALALLAEHGVAYDRRYFQ